VKHTGAGSWVQENQGHKEAPPRSALTEKCTGRNVAPRISVIIPAYNAADHLERALNSALAQTIPDIEAIVVDDGSSDATPELLREFTARDPRVRVLHNERNMGLCVSLNRAIGTARGQWIALLDADDEWLPERLERLLAIAGDSDVVSDDLNIVRNSLSSLSQPKSLSLLLRQGLSINRPHRLTLREFVRHDLGLLKPIFRRSFLRQHNFEYNRDIEFSADFHFYAEVLAAGARWLQLPHTYYIRYRHTGNMSDNTSRVATAISVSTEALLRHPAVVTDPTLAAALKRRMREWKSHAAFSTVWGLIRERDGKELVTLLFEEPSYLSLATTKLGRSLYWRILWIIRKASKRWLAKT
jgi:succinoglycan biosynthesis protein ExoO